MTHRPRSSLAVWLIVVVLLPASYVLSLGPAIWLYQHDYLPDNYGLAYWPLERLCEICPPIGDALRWYANLWLNQ